jgi:hypothetical protein
MKSIFRLLIWTFCLVLTTLAAAAQAKLVINGGIIIISNNASLVIDNPDNTAIVYNGTGYIQSEGSGNRLIWTIGPGNGNVCLVPFGNAAGYLPLQFTANSGNGAGGQFIFSTYPTPNWKNSDFLPAGVLNVNRNGIDNSAKVIDRFWQINTQGYATKPTLSNIVFTYSDLEYSAPNSITEANLVPQRWNDVSLAWGDYLPSSVINTANNTVRIATLPGNQLYQWWTLADANFALPVTLLNFTATEKNKTVETAWQTATESNSYYFEVWRSSNQLSFEATGRLAAAGSSSSLLHYSFTDAHPYHGTSYYKLKIVDRDGSFKWSAVVKVVVGDDAYISLFPNPASVSTVLTVSSGIAAAKPTASLADAKGSVLWYFRITDTYQKINTAALPAGLYRIYFMYNEKPQILSFIKK